MAFTSWSALKTAILDDLAGGKVLVAGYSIGGRSISFKSMKEVMDFIAFCDIQIKAESGGATAFAKYERPNATDEDD
jgi:hypothetical protein